MKKKSDADRPARELAGRIRKSPTAFHVIENARSELVAGGCQELRENERWKLKTPGKYYVTRNGSSLIAFSIPGRESAGFRIIASHSDSPAFKLKEDPELVENGYVRLNVEKYGGLLCAPWFDRPLSVAGRLLVREKKGKSAERIVSRLVSVDRDLLVLPSLAIHMNRDANDGMQYNIQKDMLPVWGDAADKGKLFPLLAQTAGVDEKDILGHDLFVCTRQDPTFWGAEGQYFSSPRLDDQECVWCSLDAFLSAENSRYITMFCVFDNEEVGSRTKQGAASTFLRETITRIGLAAGWSEEERMAAIADSFMISADNAHAIHPAHPDKADPVHRPRMNGGIVLKFSANQSYTTDGVSAAVVRYLCEKGKIPLQTFVNRSDVAGGSTLGNIANMQVSMNTADIGLAQLAMHSPYETAGVQDVAHLIRFAQTFYEAPVLIGG